MANIITLSNFITLCVDFNTFNTATVELVNLVKDS